MYVCINTGTFTTDVSTCMYVYVQHCCTIAIHIHTYKYCMQVVPYLP